jgi:hypothetical protein
MRGGERKSGHWQRTIETRYARDEAEAVMVIRLERKRIGKRREQSDEEREAERRRAVTLPKLKFMGPSNEEQA